MAEMIPLQYRIRAARRGRIVLWSVALSLVLLVCGTATASIIVWKVRTGAELAALQAGYAARHPLIVRSQELRTKRDHLAGRMQEMQQLMDDKVLLTLLRHVSESFSSNDALEYVHIDARSENSGKANKAGAPFVVRMTGITNNNATLAELMMRLGKPAEPKVNVLLESSQRQTFLDGQVMRFQITCAGSPGRG